MAASSAPGVKAQLLTLLAADSGLSGVQVVYSHPGSAIQQEAVYFNRVIQTEAPDSMGQRKQRESYDLEVVIDVAQDGDDAQTCEERCWALVARLENIVRTNNGPSGLLSSALGAGVGGWVVMGGVEMTPYIMDASRLCEAVCRVHVEAIK